MIKRFKLVFLTLILTLSSTVNVKADEGMWLPMFIQRLNHVDMKKMGLQLTPEEIYSVNNSSLKDAIVQLGGFCTAEVISDKGLMLTNHHCAFDAIQSKSTVENDYLTDGFWAMKHDEEIPIEGLTASFLVKMEDVTDAILKDIKEDTPAAERQKIVRAAIDSLKEKASEGNDYKVEIKSFFEGNEFYMFIYEVFRDVRMVGAPPSSIGKFGGDTDNWMWPRHTGDFALLRVYASDKNEPAEYSEDNKPYKPKNSLPISMTGVKKDDFAMVMGYPGSTDRYLSSAGVKAAIDLENPTRVKIRRKKLDILEEDMAASDDIRIKYASKHAQISNYWKYFKGQTKGLKNLDVYDKKQKEEKAFMEWANADPERKEKYGNVISDIEESYVELTKTSIAFVYVQEAVFGVDLNLLYYRMMPLYKMATDEENDFNAAAFSKKANQMKPIVEEFFKNYNVSTDKKLFAAMMEMFYNNVPKEQQPEKFRDLAGKYAPDFEKMADKVYKKTVFKSKGELYKFFNDPKDRTIQKDKGFNLFAALLDHYRNEIQADRLSANIKLQKAKKLYVEGLRKMNKDKNYYPDANFTMRMTYGKVLPYEPKDGVKYKYYTTLQGVIEKYDPADPEFLVPEKLQKLYAEKDYGQYGQDGELRVCFITNTDITGGNSGSPVIDAHGHLIGCAFDGNWEAMSGDIAFEPDLQRTISVDIRYVLFIIDKYAGAGHLVDEMDLITSADIEKMKTAKDGADVEDQSEEKEPAMAD